MGQSTEKKGERIIELAHAIKQRLNESIAQIEDVNQDIHVLSVNAKIQAVRAGALGAGFGVVADEVGKLVDRTQRITSSLQTSVDETIGELTHINRSVRGERLSQVASTAIDVVDRNLYERSCDVRWWATEHAIVQALTSGETGDHASASERLGVILDSYTVYLDIVLCDTAGKIVANGRGLQFQSQGLNVSGEKWFSEALRSENGSEFGFQGVHHSRLVDGKPALVYSCAVRRNGKSDGSVIGVLGVVFNWNDLGSAVIRRAEEMLGGDSGSDIRAYLCYDDATIIAASDGKHLLGKLDFGESVSIFNKQMGFIQSEGKNGLMIGYAYSPGYETYRSGWYAVITESAGK